MVWMSVVEIEVGIPIPWMVYSQEIESRMCSKFPTNLLLKQGTEDVQLRNVSYVRYVPVQVMGWGMYIWKIWVVNWSGIDEVW